MENPALTETTYYILLSLYHPRHGYGIMQETQQLSGGRVRLAAGMPCAKRGGSLPCPWKAGAAKKNTN